MWLYILIAIIVIILVGGVLAIYNRLVQSKNRVKEAFSTMDVYLKKRWDLIPNLVEVVKGYAEHEKSTLEEIVELRNSSYDNMSDEEKIKANEEVSKGIYKIMALAEAYPELKASENFKNLSLQVSKVEEDVANARKYYNGTIRDYNNLVEMFPSNIVAKMFGYQPKTMFEASGQERENVKIDL